MQMRAIAVTLGSESVIDEASAYIATLPPIAGVRTLDGSAESGRRIYERTCVVCHGAAGEGSETLQAPPLAGADDWYVVRQLQAFRSGRRGAASRDTIGQPMRAVAMGLSNDQEVLDLASYLAALR